MTGLLDLGAAAETGPAIEMRLKIPVAMSNSAPKLHENPSLPAHNQSNWFLSDRAVSFNCLKSPLPQYTLSLEISSWCGQRSQTTVAGAVHAVLVRGGILET
jgi:hypothetical protein